MFQAIIDFLFWFSYENTVTQLFLKKHIPYLIHLMKQNLRSDHVLSQIISPERLTAYGQKFIQFLLRKILHENFFQSQIFKLLSVLA